MVFTIAFAGPGLYLLMAGAVARGLFATRLLAVVILNRLQWPPVGQSGGKQGPKIRFTSACNSSALRQRDGVAPCP